MAENVHVDELNEAVERLARVTDELSHVVERLAECQRIASQPQGNPREQPRPRVPLLKGSDPTLAERFEEVSGIDDRPRGETHKVGKSAPLKPSSKGVSDPKAWARKAREINDRLAAQGRYFGDSTEVIRADRDSRV